MEYKKAEYLVQGDCLFIKGKKYMVGAALQYPATRTVVVVTIMGPTQEFAYGELVQVEPFVLNSTLLEVVERSKP